jgi:hypothetical protein
MVLRPHWAGRCGHGSHAAALRGQPGNRHGKIEILTGYVNCESRIRGGDDVIFGFGVARGKLPRLSARFLSNLADKTCVIVQALRPRNGRQVVQQSEV